MGFRVQGLVWGNMGRIPQNAVPIRSVATDFRNLLVYTPASLPKVSSYRPLTWSSAALQAPTSKLRALKATWMEAGWRPRGLSKSVIHGVIFGVAPFRVLITLLLIYLLIPWASKYHSSV